jgi:hypothetical protein
MAEEMMQEPTAESAPAAPETSTVVPGETQQQVQAETTAPVSESQQETAPNQESEIDEWNGNDVDSLPKPLQARARGMLRYLHKVSQEASAVKQQAQAYNEITNHPEFQEFLQWKEGRSSQPNAPQNYQAQPVSDEPLSEDDFLAAQTDPQKFVEVQERLLMQKAAPVLDRLQKLEAHFQKQEQEKVREQARQQLDAFATKHPDFWDISPIIMKGALEEVVQKNGGSVEDAYKYAKSIEKQFTEKAQNTIKQNIDARKKAVSAPPSKSMEPEVIYAANSTEANRIAYENAKLGKRVDVRVRAKK